MIKITERTINDEIVTIVQSELNKLPVNQLCTVTKVYEDNSTNIRFEDGSVLHNVKTLGIPSVDDEALLVFLNNDLGSPVVLIFK